MLGIKKIDKIRNSDIRGRSGMKDVGYIIKKQKFRYAGHVMRQEGRWGRKILEYTPWNRKRTRRRPVTRWRDEIRKEMGKNWRRETENREGWQKSGEAYAHKWAADWGSAGFDAPSARRSSDNIYS